jgi:sodium-dependent dicarboxylate transporter 2/3/5
MNLVQKVGFVAGPAAFAAVLALDLGHSPQATRTLAVAAWMLLWWITEAREVYLTALLPMVLFPGLGVLSAEQTFAPYGSPIVFLFLGGFFLALAMEQHRLHERLAFGLLRLTGRGLHGILFGFLLATAMVAMWISNTATAVMMLPIATSVQQLVAQQAPPAVHRRFGLLLMLCIAYGANIGGTMTLVGTPPNLVFAGYWQRAFGEEFGFGRWLAIGLPFGLVMLVATFVLLVRLVHPLPGGRVAGLEELCAARWHALGPMSPGERWVLAVFAVTVLGWTFGPQANEWIGAKVFDNTTVAMAGGLSCFLVPVSFRRGEFLLSWQHTQRLPWGILLLFGGGLAMAAALESCGLVDRIGEFVVARCTDSPWLLAAALTMVSLFATEVMSNVALVTVLVPVVLAIARQTGVDAAYLAIPVTLAASCAFMMPISTPPNAVVYGSGLVSMGQMLRAGIWINLLAIVVILLVAQPLC